MAKRILRLGITLRSQHTHQAFGRAMRNLGQPDEPDGGIDVVAEHGLAGLSPSGSFAEFGN